MLTPPLPHVCFFHFTDTRSLGSNGSTKFLESLLSFIPFQRADSALILECYVALSSLLIPHFCTKFSIYYSAFVLNSTWCI
jgi:hypothetical protein